MATDSPRGYCLHETQKANCAPEDGGGEEQVATSTQSSGEQFLEDSDSIALKGKSSGKWKKVRVCGQRWRMQSRLVNSQHCT